MYFAHDATPFFTLPFLIALTLSTGERCIAKREDRFRALCC